MAPLDGWTIEWIRSEHKHVNRPLSNDLAPISRNITLAEHVYHQLKRALMTGTFHPGQKITVRSVADAVDVSFTPAREAISRLLSEGALESGGPKTVIVPHMTLQKLSEIAKIRMSLESLAAECSVPNFNKAAIEELEMVQLELIAAMDRHDYKAVLDKNEVFHFSVYQRAEMPRLLLIIESLWLQIGPSLNLLYPEFDKRRSGVTNHRDVLRHLKKGNAEGVGAAFRKDISDGYDSMKRMMAD